MCRIEVKDLLFVIFSVVFHVFALVFRRFSMILPGSYQFLCWFMFSSKDLLSEASSDVKGVFLGG